VRAGPPGDDDRDPAGLHDGGADRAEQLPGPAAMAPSADHHQLRAPLLVQQCVSGMIAREDAVHGDVRVALLPAGQPCPSSAPALDV
jgi:hypothetical protein